MHEQLSKVEQRKKKYEIVNISMAAPEGEESQDYYIIKVTTLHFQILKEIANII